MAFISASVASFSSVSVKSAAKCSSFTAAAHNVAPARRSSVVTAPVITTTMTAQKYPDSDVLGLGKDVPSGLYIIASALALPLGCYSIYMSNIFTALTPESVNPQFIVGSLLVPISWGLHVAGFIQKKNNK